MSEKTAWSEDVCTCGHVVSAHVDGEGRCRTCSHDASWEPAGRRGTPCTRFQWDGEPRKRIW